jgi:hypothetical protein
VARDLPRRAELSEEAQTLPELILTEVRLEFAFDNDGHLVFSLANGRNTSNSFLNYLNSVNYVTWSSSLMEVSVLLKDS